MNNKRLWLIILLVLLCLPVLAAIAFIFAANTQSGRAFIAETAHSLSAEKLTLTGLDGHFPNQLQIGQLTWQDANGTLNINKLFLDWNPWQLLDGTAEINLVEITDLRYTPTENPTESPPSKPFSLPIAIHLYKFHISNLDLSAIAKQELSLSIDGHANLASLQEGDVNLTLRQMATNADYRVSSHFDSQTIHARLSVQEPKQGLLALLAGIHDAKPLSLTATIDGPLSALKTQSYLTWGKLNGELKGKLDATTWQADWQISAISPAMQAHADLAWQSLTVQGLLQGDLSKPTIHSNVDIKGLQTAKTKIGHINVSVQGDTGQLKLNSQISRLTLANEPKDYLFNEPLTLDGNIRLDQAQRPLAFTLHHPLLTANGNAVLQPELQSKLQLSLPNLKPLGALGGLDIAGSSSLAVNIQQQGQVLEVVSDGGIAITGGEPALVKLLGKQATIGLTVTNNGTETLLSRCQIDGKAINLKANGSLKALITKLNWQLTLNDLKAISDKTSGKVSLNGQIDGPIDDFTALADVTGELATPSFPRQPVTAKLKIEHLPKQAKGQFTAYSVVAGAPLELALRVNPQADQSLLFTIDRADWKSLHSQGTMALAKQSVWPIGDMAISIKRLQDLQVFTGETLAGALNATLKTHQQGLTPIATISMDASNTEWGNLGKIAHSKLALTVRNPIDKPQLLGRLNLEGIATREVTGSGQMDVSGIPDQLGLQVSANLNNLAGEPLHLISKAELDNSSRLLAINSLQANWQKQNLHLLAPTTISFADGLAIRHLRLGLNEAVLEADGQISPTLGLTANLQNASLATLNSFFPQLQGTGIINAEAKLQGTPDKPIGSVSLSGKDLRVTTINDKALPAAQLKATAEFDGSNARLQSKLTAGDNATLTLTGLVPFSKNGILDLHSNGTLELKLLDPLLTASGRRVRGQIAINGGVSGTLAQPQITGTVNLAKVEFRDYTLGANLTGINGLITAKNGVLLVDKLQAHAGDGTVDVKGTIEPLKEGVPVNLSITARDAKPLANDRLTVNLNADLTVRGQAKDSLLMLGSIKINRADIRIPEYMPANIAVLKIEKPGQIAPPPANANSDLKLNLIISAADEIFVRGRGVDAELNGSVQIRGNSGNPIPEGDFKLRRGQYSLGGKTLTFSQGKVGFDSGRLTDPSLNFIANTSSDNITATLTVTGTAYKPKITLSSVPDLPQDEVLARLLFSRSASSLSVLEILQIGSAVATLSGATSGMGDPLDSVRQTLGLDRLTVGGKKTSVEAGRYVIPGVYLGTRQGLTGGPQATIQVDVTKHIKLEAVVGATSPSNKNANPNTLGVIYQFEY